MTNLIKSMLFNSPKKSKKIFLSYASRSAMASVFDLFPAKPKMSLKSDGQRLAEDWHKVSHDLAIATRKYERQNARKEIK